MRSFSLAVLFLTFLLSSASAADDPFAPLLNALPRTADSVFCFDPAALSSLPGVLMPRRGGNLSGVSDSLADWSGGSFRPSAAAFFFRGEDVGLLLRGTLTPEGFSAAAEKHAAERTERNGRTCFLLGDGDGPKILLAFLPDHVLMLAEQKTAEHFLAAPAGASEEVRSALALLPRGGMTLSGVCLPSGALASQPGWSDIARIAFSVSVPGDDRLPVVSDVLLFPRKPSLAGSVYDTARKQVGSAYEAARKKGPVRPEMLYAFLVTPGAGYTKIHITLTRPDARDFLELVQSYWR